MRAGLARPAIRAENADSRSGRNCLHRRSSKSAWISGDDEGASASVCGGSRHAVFEIGTGHLNRLIDHRPIHGGHLKHLKKRVDCVLRPNVVPLLADQIIEGGYRMRRKTSFGVMLFNHCPQGFTSLGVRLSRQHDIQQNIRVQ